MRLILTNIDKQKQIGLFHLSFLKQEEDVKSGTLLDKLNVDDQYSAIIDNTIENAFLKALYQMISQKPANEALPANYTVDADLEAFLKRKYANRTVAGRA